MEWVARDARLSRMRVLAVTLLLAPALVLNAAGAEEAAVGTAIGADGPGQCPAVLAETELEFDPDPEPPADDPCGLTNVVQVLSGAEVELNRPFYATCPLAVAFERFEREVLQPAAARHLGQGVARVEHSGAYRCSYVPGGGGRRSEHATANALDVHAFVLDDGEAISVLDHWDDPGPAGAFLREVGREACEVFAAVLGPSYNEAHRDHFHFDLGPYTICSEADVQEVEAAPDAARRG
jgi:hypothetical protein